jgi:CRISPR-associated protein Cmr5
MSPLASKSSSADAATSAPETLDQLRARHAWARLDALAGDFKPREQEEYGSQAKKLPTRILTSGLGAALAFLLAKAKPGTKDEKRHLVRLHQDLTDWVIGKRLRDAAKRPDSLLESVIQDDADFLRRATGEAMAYLQWLNRFAEARGLGESEGGA